MASKEDADAEEIKKKGGMIRNIFTRCGWAVYLKTLCNEVEEDSKVVLNSSKLKEMLVTSNGFKKRMSFWANKLISDHMADEQKRTLQLMILYQNQIQDVFQQTSHANKEKTFREFMDLKDQQFLPFGKDKLKGYNRWHERYWKTEEQKQKFWHFWRDHLRAYLNNFWWPEFKPTENLYKLDKEEKEKKKNVTTKIDPFFGKFNKNATQEYIDITALDSEEEEKEKERQKEARRQKEEVERKRKKASEEKHEREREKKEAAERKRRKLSEEKHEREREVAERKRHKLSEEKHEKEREATERKRQKLSEEKEAERKRLSQEQKKKRGEEEENQKKNYGKEEKKKVEQILKQPAGRVVRVAESKLIDDHWDQAKAYVTKVIETKKWQDRAIDNILKWIVAKGEVYNRLLRMYRIYDYPQKNVIPSLASALAQAEVVEKESDYQLVEELAEQVTREEIKKILKAIPTSFSSASASASASTSASAKDPEVLALRYLADESRDSDDDDTHTKKEEKISSAVDKDVEYEVDLLRENFVRLAIQFSHYLKAQKNKNSPERHNIVNHARHAVQAIDRQLYTDAYKNLRVSLLKTILDVGKADFQSWWGTYGDPRDKTYQNIILSGPPGSGKSTSVETIQSVYFRLGLITQLNVTALSVSDLVSAHVSASTKLTHRSFVRGLESVIFVDEAYAMLPRCRSASSSSSASDSHGVEAINELMRCLDVYNKLAIVVVAGYKAEMLCWKNSNPGLDRRFPPKNRFEMKSLTVADVIQILLRRLPSALNMTRSLREEFYREVNSYRQIVYNILTAKFAQSIKPYFPAQGASVQHLLGELANLVNDSDFFDESPPWHWLSINTGNAETNTRNLNHNQRLLEQGFLAFESFLPTQKTKPLVPTRVVKPGRRRRITL